MASIQILELHPVEAQIEELSYDMTDIIRGGGFLDFLAALEGGLRVTELFLESGNPVEARLFAIQYFVEVALPALAA